MTTLFDWQAERDSALAQVERNAGEDFKARAMAFALDWMAGEMQFPLWTETMSVKPTPSIL